MNFIPDNVSEHTNVYDVLKERGFIEQTTDDEAIRELLGKEKIKFYIGFDPTADCLHVGHFMQVIIMMYMQKYGHTPVVLIGGGTGTVSYTHLEQTGFILEFSGRGTVVNLLSPTR